MIIIVTIATVIICTIHYLINKEHFEKAEPLEPSKPFIVSEYYDRTEKAALDILETQEPVDQTIILWWGLDGLRLNEDGSLEWVSRKKLKPVNQNVSWQLCQNVTYIPQFDACQSTQATREQLFNLNMQLQMANFNVAMQNQINGFDSAFQRYMVQAPIYPAYPSYINAGSVQFPSQLTGCCNAKLRWADADKR